MELLTSVLIREKVDLCRNCTNAFSCSLKSNHDLVVTQCEEHEEERGLSIIEQDSVSETSNQTFTSLCQNCEHLSYCSLKDSREVVLVCEQYE